MGTTITFTDDEMAHLRRALEAYNDIEEDTMYENLPVNLYMREGESVEVTATTARNLLQALDQVHCDRLCRHNLLRKVGIEVNEEGMSA